VETPHVLAVYFRETQINQEEIWKISLVNSKVAVVIPTVRILRGQAKTFTTSLRPLQQNHKDGHSKETISGDVLKAVEQSE